MIYEIVNPSDAYTMVSDDPAAACAACWILGEGKYGLTDEDGKNAAPIMIFGGDPEQTMLSLHGVGFNDVMTNRRPAIVAAMASVMIGSIASRQEAESAIALMTPENAAKFLAARHDKRRTSMNNIGRRAAQLATAFAEQWDQTVVPA